MLLSSEWRIFSMIKLMLNGPIERCTYYGTSRPYSSYFISHVFLQNEPDVCYLDTVQQGYIFRIFDFFLTRIYYLFIYPIILNYRHLRHPNIIELLDVLSPTILSRIEDSGILKGMQVAFLSVPLSVSHTLFPHTRLAICCQSRNHCAIFYCIVSTNILSSLDIHKTYFFFVTQIFFRNNLDSDMM